MAASTLRRVCLLKITCMPHRTLSAKFCSGSPVVNDKVRPKDSDTKERAVPENIMQVSLQPKAPTKAQKISRAMQAYLERAQTHDKMITAQINEYEIGKRHLANIMGQDPDLFTQNDINKAIEYLLPSGLTHIKARPVLKHPYEIFPKRKAAQFDTTGRPFHTMFYTGKPNFYHLLHEVSWKIEDLKKEEDRLFRKGQLTEAADKKLTLYGSDWITANTLKDLMLEPIEDGDHKQFTILMNKLVQQTLSYKEEEFIMKYRRKLMIQSFSQNVPQPLVDENGRSYMKAEGWRKSSKAQVTLWIKGSGKFTINGKDIEYFKETVHREQIMTPLQFTGLLGEVDVEATVTDGGESGQSGAIRLALSKALMTFVDMDMREKMRYAGLLTLDYRTRERKKAGQEGARRKFTWKKRCLDCLLIAMFGAILVNTVLTA